MRCLGGRVVVPEILDTLKPEEARASLGDLVRINQRWGGWSSLRKILAEADLRGANFSWLDVGAASGDMGEEVRRLCPGAWVVSMDYVISHLDACPGELVAGDAFSLPFADHSFDFVFSSLFLHHFEAEQIVALLKEFARVARRAVLAIDLPRNPIAYYFLPATSRIFGWDPITVHDGAISVEAGFRKRELAELARAAGLTNFRVKSHGASFRVSLIAEV